MNLTGKEIVEKGIVTNVFSPECIAQHGVDLQLIKVQRVTSGGFIPESGKTILADRETIEPIYLDKYNTLCWRLEVGTYDITFKQGCKIPPDQRMQLIQRSSLLRNGALLVSSLFDAGFETENIGTVLFISETLTIEVGARVAQAYTTSSNEVQNLYNGQFQKDSQREPVESL